MAGNAVTTSRGNTHDTDDKCWKQAGFSSTNTASFITYAAGAGQPFGVGFDNSGNVLIADYADTDYMKYVGFTSTTSSVINGENTGTIGAAWDGTNLLGADYANDNVYKHTGFTTTTTSNFAGANDLRGITWDGTNLITCDIGTTDKIWRYTGFTSSVESSFNLSDRADAGWDGTNLLTIQNAGNTTYQHTGFTSSVNTSFTAQTGGGTTADGVTDDAFGVAASTSIKDIIGGFIPFAR